MILCVGDIMVDIFLLSDLQRAEQGSGLLLRGGGSAANTAAWLAAAGTPSAFVGCVAEDTYGASLVSELRESGVDPRVRTVPDSETGAVLIRVEPDGAERVMQSSRGANTALMPDGIQDAAEVPLTAIHVTGYALLGPSGLDILTGAAAAAARTGAWLSFDPSSPGVIERFGAANLMSALAESADMLLPNAEEAAALTGATDPGEAARSLAEIVPTVVVKTGENGCIYSREGITAAIPATCTRPIDPTGAGDAFNAGILSSLAQGASLEVACRAAVRLGTAAITRYGGRPLHRR